MPNATSVYKGNKFYNNTNYKRHFANNHYYFHKSVKTDPYKYKSARGPVSLNLPFNSSTESKNHFTIKTTKVKNTDYKPFLVFYIYIYIIMFINIYVFILVKLVSVDL